MEVFLRRLRSWGSGAESDEAIQQEKGPDIQTNHKFNCSVDSQGANVLSSGSSGSEQLEQADTQVCTFGVVPPNPAVVALPELFSIGHVSIHFYGNMRQGLDS